MKKFVLEVTMKSNLKQICARNDIVICPTYKGGGVVILNKFDYLIAMNRLLSDNAIYTQLATNPTVQFKKEHLSLINEGFSLGVLNKNEKLHLVPSAPRVPAIYYLPKVHKSMSNPPGRPINNGIDSVTAGIGRYIDEFLQPLVTATPSSLTGCHGWSEGFILAMADVTSLYYTIISHEQGTGSRGSPFLSPTRPYPISD